MKPLSRRQFLMTALAASSLLIWDLSSPTGALGPVFGEIHKQEPAKFSGEIYFNQMHIELIGRKREGRKRIYPSEKSARNADILIVGGGIAGLISAYLLLSNPTIRRKGATVRVLELNDEAGGTAREYEWGGIPYTNGAAYFYLMEPGHVIMKLYRDLGILDEIVRPGTADKDSVIIKNRIIPNLLADGRGNSRETADLRHATDFFATVDEQMYPEVPFNPAGDYSREEFVRIDRMSFGELLQKGGMPLGKKSWIKVPSRIPPIMSELIESYCYSSFGCSSFRVSAWQGLNWFASECAEGGVAVLPGGNGRITTRLVEKIGRLDPDCLITSMPVVDITCDATSGTKIVTVALRRDARTCAYRTFRASHVLCACPIFVSKRILLSEFPENLRRRIESLNYSAYVVGNVMIDASVFPGYWDTYCLDDYAGTGKSGEQFYGRKAFMDIINATWALRKSPGRTGPMPDKTVITVYSPHPFKEQRKALLQDSYCETMKERIKRDLLVRLSSQGLSERSISDVRIARWGHAMLQANPGLLSGGLLENLQASVAQKGIYFAGTEILGAPTVENCHLTAHAAVKKIVRAFEEKSAEKSDEVLSMT